MPLLSHPAFGPRASLVYITVGSILDIIVTCWFIFMVDKSKSFEENRVTLDNGLGPHIAYQVDPRLP